MPLQSLFDSERLERLAEPVHDSLCARAGRICSSHVSVGATGSACHTPLTHPHTAFYYSSTQPARISNCLYLAHIRVLVFNRLLLTYRSEEAQHTVL